MIPFYLFVKIHLIVPDDEAVRIPYRPHQSFGRDDLASHHRVRIRDEEVTSTQRRRHYIDDDLTLGAEAASRNLTWSIELSIMKRLGAEITLRALRDSSTSWQGAHVLDRLSTFVLRAVQQVGNVVGQRWILVNVDLD